MRRRAPAVILLFAACRRDAPSAPHAPDGTITVASSDVEFGRAFPLTVTRVAREGAKAADEPTLAPLVTRLVATTTRRGADEHEIVEERRYLARAFTTGEVDLPSLQLHVRSSLPPDDAGRPELPEAPLPVPRPSNALRSAILAGAAALAAGVLALVLARRRGRGGASVAPGALRVAPEVRARARLEALRRRPLADRAELLALHEDATELLRDYVAERGAPCVASRTSEELVDSVARVAAIGAAPRALLATLLPPLDRVRFGNAPVSRDAALRLLDGLDAFVSETTP